MSNDKGAIGLAIWRGFSVSRQLASAKSTSMLIGGAGLGQLALVLASPALTRLYSPSEFGAFATYAVVLSVAAIVSSLRLDIAVTLARTEAEALELAAMAISIVAVFACLVGTALGNAVPGLTSVPTQITAWFLPLGILATGFYNVLAHLAVRDAAFTALSQSRIVLGVSSALAQIGLGIGTFGFIGLVGGDLVGRLMSLLVLARRSWSQLLENFRRIDHKHLAGALKKHRKFPIIVTGSTLLNNLGLQLPPLVIAVTYGTAAAGLFALAYRVIALPSSLIAGAAGQVYLAQASRAQIDGKSLRPVMRDTTMSLLLVGLIPALVVLLAAPIIFSAVFGREWIDSGRFAQYLVVAVFLQMIVSPVSQTLMIIDRPGIQAIWDGCRLLIVIGAIAIPKAMNQSVEIAVLAFGVGTAVAYASLFVLTATAKPDAAAQKAQEVNRPAS